MTIRTLAYLILLTSLLYSTSGCVGKPFKPQSEVVASFQQRAESRVQGAVRVTTTVPSPDETQKFFDLDLYGRGIQPVWLEVENNSSDHLRFAPTGLDREYFSPLEVAYVLKSGRSTAARKAMNKYLHDSAMPRRIPPNTTLSGFVFTHSTPGTKSFSIDIFGSSGSGYSFIFFIPVPGFTPDHADIDETTLYPAEKLRKYSLDEFKDQLSVQPLRADRQGDPGTGRPINVLLVGKAEDLLHALLRAGWYEVARPTSETEIAKAQHLNNRVADAVLRKRRQGSTVRNELLVWLSPIIVEGRPVWWAQTNQFFSDWLGQSVLDPDVDDATAYLLQDLWYSQGLARFGWGASHAFEGEKDSLFVTPFFTSGLRAVLWLTANPVSMLETERLNLESPEGDSQ